MKLNTILYVRDQKLATDFYSKVLDVLPNLNVVGMTEFQLSEGQILGLMPESGIKRLLGNAIPDPGNANGIPRVEIYITIENPEKYHARALANGAKELSPYQVRDWGDAVAYSLDLDGHVLAFAKRL